MGYLLRHWERAARRAGRLRSDERVLGLWLCTGLEPNSGDVEPDWAPLVRRITLKSIGTRAAVLALTDDRLLVSGTGALVPIDLAHLGVIQTVVPNVIHFEVLIPTPVRTARFAMAKPGDALTARNAIDTARTARWQGLGLDGSEEIKARFGRDVEREMRARWYLADRSRGGRAAASMMLGHLLIERGHRPEAEALLREAMADPNREFAARAALDLGYLLRDAADLDAARSAFTAAVTAGSVEESSEARYELALLSEKAGDHAQADRILAELGAAGDPVWAPIALVKLAALRKAAGDFGGAETAYRSAIASGHENLAPSSAVDLAIMLADQGRTEEAELLYRQAISTDHHEHSIRATLNLGNIARNRGDLAAAETAFRRVVESGDTRLAAKAWFNLGHMAKDAGDLTAANHAFLKVITADDAQLARIASQRLNELQSVTGGQQARAAVGSRRRLSIIIRPGGVGLILAAAACLVLAIHDFGLAWLTSALVTTATVLAGVATAVAILRLRRVSARRPHRQQRR